MARRPMYEGTITVLLLLMSSHGIGAETPGDSETAMTPCDYLSQLYNLRQYTEHYPSVHSEVVFTCSSDGPQGPEHTATCIGDPTFQLPSKWHLLSTHGSVLPSLDNTTPLPQCSRTGNSWANKSAGTQLPSSTPTMTSATTAGGSLGTLPGKPGGSGGGSGVPPNAPAMRTTTNAAGASTTPINFGNTSTSKPTTDISTAPPTAQQARPSPASMVGRITTATLAPPATSFKLAASTQRSAVVASPTRRASSGTPGQRTDLQTPPASTSQRPPQTSQPASTGTRQAAGRPFGSGSSPPAPTTHSAPLTPPTTSAPTSGIPRIPTTAQRLPSVAPSTTHFPGYPGGSGQGPAGKPAFKTTQIPAFTAGPWQTPASSHDGFAFQPRTRIPVNPGGSGHGPALTSFGSPPPFTAHIPGSLVSSSKAPASTRSVNPPRPTPTIGGPTTGGSTSNRHRQQPTSSRYLDSTVPGYPTGKAEANNNIVVVVAVPSASAVLVIVVIAIVVIVRRRAVYTPTIKTTNTTSTSLFAAKDLPPVVSQDKPRLRATASLKSSSTFMGEEMSDVDGYWPHGAKCCAQRAAVAGDTRSLGDANVYAYATAPKGDKSTAELGSRTSSPIFEERARQNWFSPSAVSNDQFFMGRAALPRLDGNVGVSDDPSGSQAYFTVSPDERNYSTSYGMVSHNCAIADDLGADFDSGSMRSHNPGHSVRLARSASETQYGGNYSLYGSTCGAPVYTTLSTGLDYGERTPTGFLEHGLTEPTYFTVVANSESEDSPGAPSGAAHATVTRYLYGNQELWGSESDQQYGPAQNSARSAGERRQSRVQRTERHPSADLEDPGTWGDIGGTGGAGGSWRLATVSQRRKSRGSASSDDDSAGHRHRQPLHRSGTSSASMAGLVQGSLSEEEKVC